MLQLQYLRPMDDDIVIAAFGAAQFGPNSGINLDSRVPNIFGQDGAYIEFYVFQSTASEWTILGSNIAPDAIVINDDTITLTNENSSDSITLAESLSTTDWTYIRLIRSGNAIQCWIGPDPDSLVQEVETFSVIALTLGTIGKNAPAYTHVDALSLSLAEEDYLHRTSPGVSLQGHEDGFWVSGQFKLDEAGDYTIADCLNGNDGWKVEVLHKYFSKHKLKFTVGNGTTTQEIESTELCVPQEWIPWRVMLEKLDAEPDPGDTTIEGFSPETGDFYFGADRGTSQFTGGKHAAFYGGVGALSDADTEWLLSGKLFDDFSVSSQITLSELSFAYGFSEANGTRADLVGSEDLTEVPGYAISATKENGGFETLGTGGFAIWSESASGSSSVNVESSEQYAGTYCARLDIDGSSSEAILRRFNPPFVNGKEYTFRVHAKVTGSIGTVKFRWTIDGTNSDVTFLSNDWTQYTLTKTVSDNTNVMDIKSQGGANRSFYFDNVEVQATEIGKVDGPRRGNVNAAAFTGYLRGLKIFTGEFYVELPLLTDAADVGGDSNDGTETNITWATTDPAAA